MRIIPNINIICGQISGICAEKYGEYFIINLLSLIMQGDNVVTTPGCLISVFSFIISKGVDKLWNYLDTCRLASRLTVNDKSVLVGR